MISRLRHCGSIQNGACWLILLKRLQLLLIFILFSNLLCSKSYFHLLHSQTVMEDHAEIKNCLTKRPQKIDFDCVYVWNGKKTLDSSVPCVTKLLPDEPFWCDIAEINLNTWNVLLFPCRNARGGRGIDKNQTKQNKSKLTGFSSAHCQILSSICSCWSNPCAGPWNLSGFGHIFKSVTDVTRVCSSEPCSNTCDPWQMSVR